MTVLKVLLVEDRSDWRSLLELLVRHVLQDIGQPNATTKVTATFSEALKLLSEDTWHLLITDIGLGDSRQKLGIQLVKEAHAQDIRAVAVSGTPVTPQDSCDLLTEHGASAFFYKLPFNRDKFISTVKELLTQAVEEIENDLNNQSGSDHQPNVKIILSLASSPVDKARLRLDKEVHEINEGLRRSRKRDQFRIEQRWAVQIADLRRAFLDIEPQIVHFCGHGVEDEGLVVEDEDGKAKLVSTEALVNLFELCSDHVECVLLNACYSEIQADAIAQHIPYVVGMSDAVGDTAAIKFAVGFYDALGAGKSIETAYKFGCNAIQLENIPEHLTPKLKKKK